VSHCQRRPGRLIFGSGATDGDEAVKSFGGWHSSREDEMTSLRTLFGAIVGAILAAAPSTASAQAWPTRAIQLISPFTAGNANDTVARVVLDQVSRQLGQVFVIENRPGGGGTIGPAFVAKADPDGYTLLLHSSSLSSQVVLHKTLPYDALRDFAPVVLFGIQPNVLVVAPSRGFNTVADLIAAAKAKPGSLNFASAGIGSASHMAAERLRLAAGIDVQHIPFRGAEGLTELMSGRIDFYFVPIAPAIALVEQGKVKALAVSTPKRSPILPNVPTTAEAGYPDAAYLFWGGLAAPAKTPRAIVDRLHDETQKALDMPAVQERLAKLGVQPQPMSVEQLEQFVRDDLAATVKLGADAHIVPTD
jgi:tripartite-type tricarboxylate transporter receptor subunit TctC